MNDIVDRLKNFSSAQDWESTKYLITDAIDRIVQLETAIKNLEQAIVNEGPNPIHHRRILLEHRNQWPTLWRSLDALIEGYHQ